MSKRVLTEAQIQRRQNTKNWINGMGKNILGSVQGGGIAGGLMNGIITAVSRNPAVQHEIDNHADTTLKDMLNKYKGYIIGGTATVVGIIVWLVTKKR